MHPANERRVREALKETNLLYGADRAKALREMTGLGLADCTRIIEVDDVERAIANLDTRDGEDIRRVLRRLLGLIR